jgi:hypothetical protein
VNGSKKLGDVNTTRKKLIATVEAAMGKETWEEPYLHVWRQHFASVGDKARDLMWDDVIREETDPEDPCGLSA